MIRKLKRGDSNSHLEVVLEGKIQENKAAGVAYRSPPSCEKEKGTQVTREPLNYEAKPINSI